MRKISLKSASLSEWEHEARLRIAGYPVLTERLLEDRAVVVTDRTALAYVLWASRIPGWADAVDVVELEQHEVAVDAGTVPDAVRDAIDALVDAFDLDEIGQLDGEFVDALRPYRT